MIFVAHISNSRFIILSMMTLNCVVSSDLPQERMHPTFGLKRVDSERAEFSSICL